MQEPLFLDIKVPLPSLAEQNKLVEEYNAIIEEGNKIDIQIESIRQKIQSYLLNAIGIKDSNNLENNKTAECQYKYLKFTNLSDINRWDYWEPGAVNNNLAPYYKIPHSYAWIL